VEDDTRLFYTIDEVRERYRQTRGLPRTRLDREDLRELPGVVQGVRSASAEASIQEGPPIRIATPAGRWSYAAIIPLTISANPAGALWVRVRARVLRGEAGFGVLNRAGTAFQDRGFLPAEAAARMIFLKVENPLDAASLVIENSTADGQPADILLDDVAVFGSCDA